jgi:hypothetical protein
MRRLSFLNLAPLLFLTHCTPAAESDESVAAKSSVIDGKLTDAHPAAGYLVDRTGTRHCSAVLVRPTVVLSAAHCWDGPSVLHFGVGKFKRGGKLYRAREIGDEVHRFVRRHPAYDGTSHDLAFISLEEPVKGVKPAVIGDHEALDACNFEVVGYGRSLAGPVDTPVNKASGYRDERRSATICLTGVQESSGFLTAVGKDGSTCRGDSGGGLMVKNASVDTVVAVVRGGLDENTTCETGATLLFQALSTEAGFVREALEADDEPPPLRSARNRGAEPRGAGAHERFRRGRRLGSLSLGSLARSYRRLSRALARRRY